MVIHHERCCAHEMIRDQCLVCKHTHRLQIISWLNCYSNVIIYREADCYGPYIV